nr:MAG TPA: hypothetical protein [Bacteriophage sp.]
MVSRNITKKSNCVFNIIRRYSTMHQRTIYLY